MKKNVKNVKPLDGRQGREVLRRAMRELSEVEFQSVAGGGTPPPTGIF